MLRHSLSLFLIFFFFACGPKVTQIDKYAEGAKNGNMGDIKKLLKLLEYPDEDIKVKAYLALNAVPEKEKKKLVQLTINLMKKSDTEGTKEFTIGLLGKLKAKEALPELIKLSKDTNFKRRYVIFSALGEIQDETAVDSIIDALKDSNTDVKKYAARALIKIGPKAIPRMIERFKTSDLETQGYLIRAFGELRNNQSEDVLISSLNTPNRLDAIWALGKSGTKKSLPYIIDLAKSKDYETRIKVCQALGDLNQKEAIPILKKALNDKEVLVREWAARSLEVLTGERTYYKDSQGKNALPYNIYH